MQNWFEPEAGGLPLGIFADYEYRTVEAELKPGDRLLIYSDGLTEAADLSGVQFGPVRSQELLHRLARADLGAEEICRQIADEVMAYQGPRQLDDVSLICVARKR